MFSRTCIRASSRITTLQPPSVAQRHLSRSARSAARLATYRAPLIQTFPWQNSSVSSIRGATRTYVTRNTSADAVIEDITEQYATTKDEFEIAVEETEKNTLYAAEDRAAAAEEMAKLKEMYNSALSDNPEAVAADIKRRIGQRIRELDEAIKGLEESATHEP